jgi:DNA-binding NarL/FixJ family response regulator
MPSLIKVALASDNSQVLDQARAGLAAEKAVRIVGEAREGKETVALVSQRRPTLLIVDMALPPAGGLPVVAQVRKGSPKTRVLAIDDRLNEQRVLKLAKAGAYGYMLGEAIPAYLAKAVRVMAAGEVWLSRKLMGRLVEELERLVRLRARPRRPLGR